ncbi:MAG: DUF5518 domain-containing protein [Coriobacteriia bacterium]|nr:DUF5518 domain-containing protein [Coriobacteriia bacterium]
MDDQFLIKGLCGEFYMKDGSVGFLVCNDCKGVYELQSGESVDDFGLCQCGGELEYSMSSKLKPIRNKLKYALILGVGVGFASSLFLRMTVLGVLVGGFVAAYMLGGTFKDALKSGFITGAIIMFLINLMILILGLIKNQDRYGVLGMNVHGPGMTIIFIIVTMFIGGVIAALTGLIGVKIKSIMSK